MRDYVSKITKFLDKARNADNALLYSSLFVIFIGTILVANLGAAFITLGVIGLSFYTIGKIYTGIKL